VTICHRRRPYGHGLNGSCYRALSRLRRSGKDSPELISSTDCQSPLAESGRPHVLSLGDWMPFRGNQASTDCSTVQALRGGTPAGTFKETARGRSGVLEDDGES